MIVPEIQCIYLFALRSEGYQAKDSINVEANSRKFVFLRPMGSSDLPVTIALSWLV